MPKAEVRTTGVEVVLVLEKSEAAALYALLADESWPDHGTLADKLLDGIYFEMGELGDLLKEPS